MILPTPPPAYQDELATVYLGEACQILRSLPTGLASCVITDPPYSSGGMMRGDRAGASCQTKYQNTSTEKTYDEFSGDNRDQRSFITWASIWLEELRRVTRPGAIVGCFVDWRQLPAMTDAMQVGGMVWRGIVPWNKPGSRPMLGRFTNSCEYLVWGTNGPREVAGPAFSGCYTVPVARDKRHITEKPVELLNALCRIAFEPDAVILDPFMGSGTTLAAAKSLGKKCVGIELTASICETAIARLREPVQPELIG